MANAYGIKCVGIKNKLKNALYKLNLTNFCIRFHLVLAEPYSFNLPLILHLLSIHEGR
jgi:hypothetical protein